jgi:hypothetical protein
MNPAPTSTTSAAGAAQDVRLRLKPVAPVSGYVDGGWWPRSRDLAGELSSLLPALAGRLGPIARVAYHLDGWEPAPRRVFVPGGRVAFEGFRTTDRDTLTVVDGGPRVRGRRRQRRPERHAARRRPLTGRNRMSRRITILLRGGHQVVLQGVDDEEATRLVERIRDVFDQSVPSGSTLTGDGTLIRNAEIVGVRSTSEQELRNR